jgi:GTP cyclohydrolase I
MTHTDHAREAEVERAAEDLLAALDLDRSDPNLTNTPGRLARLYVREVFAGLYTARPSMTSFPASNVDQLYSVGPIAVRSTCAHHFAPIVGECWIAVLPSDRLLGLSKFARLTQWVMARPHTQETATQMLAEEIHMATQAQGVGVVVRAAHLCMTWRGVKEHASTMVTSVMTGKLREVPEARAEAFALFAAQGFKS